MKDFDVDLQNGKGVRRWKRDCLVAEVRNRKVQGEREHGIHIRSECGQ